VKRVTGVPTHQATGQSAREAVDVRPGAFDLHGCRLNHSTQDSDTRCPGRMDIAGVHVLPVYECCMA